MSAATRTATSTAGLRIVRMANFVAPASGQLRTALRELGAGHRAAGHEPVLIIPGTAPRRSRTSIRPRTGDAGEGKAPDGPSPGTMVA